MNRIVLTGRLTKHPELKKTPNGNSITNFTVAVDNGKNKKGEKETAFIDVIAFNNVADNVVKFMSKGALVGVDGRLHQRSYEAKDGRRINVIEIYADMVHFLESKKQEPNEDDQEQSSNLPTTTDDDLPF